MKDNKKTNPEELVEQLRLSTEFLEAIVADRALLNSVDAEDRKRFLIAAGQVSRPTKHQRKALAKAKNRQRKLDKRAEDTALLNRTGIRKLRESPIFLTPRRIAQHAGEEPTVSQPIGEAHEQRLCYCCQNKYSEVHFFYDQMCITCGDFNFAKRSLRANLDGRVALITGARVKIGYQAAILLLRSGAQVIVVTRFPKDAAKRYAAEDDFQDWADRLQIYGVDLRHTPSVERFCQDILATYDRLDCIINNACQTVRRPSGFYDHLMDLELGQQVLSAPEAALLAEGASAMDQNMEVVGAGASAALSQVELLPQDAERGHHLFPAGELDADLQQVDLRKVNSWRLKLADVSAVELLEVQLVNAVAPFIINARLKPLMMRVPTADKHIVNVSAMEGQFYRIFKTDRHPHTNMAKAALNMMTRTSAIDYKEHGIHMNSVDTGWVTDEDPDEHARLKREVHRFHPPLDIVDGAARIVDPFISGLVTGEHYWGQFLKDYVPTDW